MGYVIHLLFYKHIIFKALLRYNLHTTKFTCFKCMIQLFLVNLHHCAAIIIIRFQNIFITRHVIFPNSLTHTDRYCQPLVMKRDFFYKSLILNSKSICYFIISPYLDDMSEHVRLQARRLQQLWHAGSRAHAQQLWRTGLVAPQHVGSSWTRARTCVPCIGRQILNHCATREVPQLPF